MKIIIIGSLFTTLLLAGCGNSKFAELSRTELQDRYTSCENSDNMSPGAAITCDNIRRECKKRHKKTGRKACY